MAWLTPHPTHTAPLSGSVTYSVHILQHFVHGGEGITDRKQRIIHAISTTGYTLTCGFFCVVLGNHTPTTTTLRRRC